MEYLTYLADLANVFIAHGGFIVYFALLVAAFLESIPLAGIIVPSGIFLIIAGFFARGDTIDFTTAFIATALGAALGDIGGYYLGRRYGLSWLNRYQRLAKAMYFDKGKKYFLSHGDKSVLFARFVGPIRPIIPFVAGVFQMAQASFIFFNVMGAMLWALTFLSFGYFFGASWEIAERWASALGFVGVITLIILIFSLFVWHSIARQRQAFMRLVKELLRSLGGAVATNQEIRAFVARHPKMIAWIAGRVDKKSLSGRYLTIGVLLTSYLLWYTITIPLQIVTQGPMYQIDVHTARLMVQLHDGTLNQLFTGITELGGIPIVVSIALTVGGVCCVRGKYREVMSGGIALGATSLLVYFGKLLIHRPRPDIAPLVFEESFSLPSGHAAHAIVLYGWIAYLLFLSTKSRRLRIAILTVSTVLILLIGLSRVYLGVHWVSDVLIGYALGGSILTTTITASELYRSFVVKKARKEKELSKKKFLLVISFILIEITFLSAYFATHRAVSPKLPVRTQPTMISEQDLVHYIASDMPKLTQTLGGRPQEPISLIFVGTRAQITESFEHARWSIADPITKENLKRVALAALNNTSYATAPITPVFYNGHPHEFAVQQETERSSVRQRHHARFWDTSIRLQDGREVWAGTASYDVGLKRLVTHKIDPAIDVERDYLLNELLNNNTKLSSEKIKITQATWGRNFTGDLFFTDGEAYLVMWPKKDE